MNDNVLTAKSSHTEFFRTDTGKANGLPNLWNVSLLCGVESSLVSLELDVSLG